MLGQAAVSQALRDNVVIQLNDGLNTMQCKVCQKQMFGLSPMQQHLSGSSHKEMAAKYAMKNPLTAPPTLLSLLLPRTKKAVKQGVIEVAASGCTRCTVCGNTLTGTRQIEDHLEGEDHKKKSDVRLQRVLPPIQNVMYNPLAIQTPIFNPAPPVLTPSSMVGAVALPSEDELVSEALRTGHILQTDRDTDPFVCISCSKRFNGKRTLYEHLKSKEHKKKLSLNAPNVTPVPSLKQTNVGNYSVKSLPRGQVHVFNYKFAGHGFKWVRDGAEHDSRNLKTTFNNMGYEIRVHESLDKSNTWEMILRIRNDTRLQNVDSLIFFFLSHGKDPYTFHTNDKGELNVFNIRNLFTNGECRQMKDKPKIFFMNYCRGDKMELRKVDGSSDQYAESPDDMLTIHAAAEGIAAYRSTEKGTHFVEILCEMLKSYGRTFDLRNIYLMLRDQMTKRNSNKPMWEDYGFKEFHFNPV